MKLLFTLLYQNTILLPTSIKMMIVPIIIYITCQGPLFYSDTGMTVSLTLATIFIFTLTDID